jgi:hypothetical protein
MQRSELEHIIRVSGDVAQDDEIVIIGSQSILGQFPDAPIRLLASMEADVYPKHHPERADKVDGAKACAAWASSKSGTVEKAFNDF